MSKVTMQDVADALGVSRVSVWKVFNGQPGVSDTLKNNVLETASKLGYNGLTAITAVTENINKYKTVSLVVSRPDSSIFWTDIIHSIAKELSTHNVNLMYTYIPSTYKDNFQLPEILTGDDIGGIIVLNLYDKHIIKRISKLDIPKLFLDTVPSITENILGCDLMLIEGRNSISEIVNDVVKKGCKRLGFIGDVHYARTNLERYYGYTDSLTKHNIPFDSSICFTDTIGISSYQSRIFAFLDSISEMPDAFICVSDYVAQFVAMYVSKYPERFPKPIILTGFDGNKEYVNVADKITTANVNTRHLGRRLALQILYRMDYPNAPRETIYTHPEISYLDSYFS
ncbi:MAG: LacI family DNA-binding transcriptional regulator [Catonella sp.]|uniref:LacI family DNA-binding transcriptional regulator n=1 Tax=Catonella sp. TaxID=2382125 RepID=UPI003FA0F0A5